MYVGRVVSECLLLGCPVLVKIKIPFVMRVFKILKVGENLNFHPFKYQKKKSIDRDTLHICTTWVALSRCFGFFLFKDSWIHHRKQRSHNNLLPDNLPKETLGVTFLNTLKIRLEET